MFSFYNSPDVKYTSWMMTSRKPWHRSDNIPAQHVYKIRITQPIETVYGMKVYEVERSGKVVDWKTSKHCGYIQTSQQRYI